MLSKQMEDEFLEEWHTAIQAVPHENCASELGYNCDCRLSGPLRRLDNIVHGFVHRLKRL